jgi:hypothetical protein
VYEADGEVVAQCAARGDATVTARRLERWRQAGCLPTRPAEHRTGLRGSASANPAGYVEQVLAISTALRGGLALRYVPVALFADGYPVELDALRAGYLALLADLRTISTKVAGSHDDPLDAADAAAVAFTARLGASMLAPMSARARQAVSARPGRHERGEARALVEGALSAAFGGLLAGQTPSPEGTRELLTLAGLDDGQDMETSARHLAAANVDAIEHAVDAAPWGQWLEARRMVEAIYLYMRRRKRAERLALPPGQRLPGLELELPDDAFSRGCLIPQQLVISEAERDFARRRATAMDALTTHLETGATADDPDDADEHGEQRRANARARLEAWTAAHPTDTRLLLGVDNADPAAGIPAPPDEDR